MLDASEAAQQLVGAVFNGRWKLMRLVGEGGMGAVYEAHGLNGEGVRAIKVLHAEFTSEEQILARFFAEAQAVQSLRHANVAQIFEHQRAEDGTPYLIMEFLRGTPLSGIMHPGKPLPPEQAATIMVGVLEALAVAHQKGIVHRDLKPDNLFMVDAGNGQHTVKVLDFGIAKIMDGAGGMGSKTKTGVLLGTPGYMSPEQIKNSKGVDPRSDLWSVGIILYEMLTGQEAFPADNEFQRLTLVLTQDIRPIAGVRPELAGWAQFFQRALAKEIPGRFQSAGEMAQALTAMVARPGQSGHAQAGGTVALDLRALQAQAAAHSHVGGGHPQSYAASQPMASMQQPSMQQPSMQQGGHPYPTAASQVHPASQQQPSSPYPQSAVGAMSAARPHSVPPAAYPAPTPQANPATHISAGRPMGAPTLSQGSGGPSVDLIAPPPVGAPWWVVFAVGGATFVLGFLVGYFVG